MVQGTNLNLNPQRMVGFAGISSCLKIWLVGWLVGGGKWVSWAFVLYFSRISRRFSSSRILFSPGDHSVGSCKIVLQSLESFMVSSGNGLRTSLLNSCEFEGFGLLAGILAGWISLLLQPAPESCAWTDSLSLTDAARGKDKWVLRNFLGKLIPFSPSPHPSPHYHQRRTLLS